MLGGDPGGVEKRKLVRWRRLISTVIVLAVLPMGSDAESPEEPLSVRTAAEEALRANPDLRAAYEVIEIARGRLLQAGLWPNPELVFSGRDDFAFENEGERSMDVGFTQRFPVAGRLARARDVALVDIAIALTEVRDFERILISDAQRSVVTLLTLELAITEQTRVIAAARRLARASSARLRVAEVSEADVNLLEIELTRFEQDHRLLELDRHTEAVRLNRLLNRAPEAPVKVLGNLEAPLFEPRATAQLIEPALRRRPDLQRLRFERDRSGAEVQLARAEAWEDWTIGVDYSVDKQVFQDEPSVDPIGTKRDSFLGVGISVPLPLFNRNQGRIAAARAEGRRAAARLIGLERTVEAEVETATRRVEELAQVAAEYRERIVPRATRNVTLLEKGYRQGLIGVSVLVQGEQQYADVALRYARVMGDLRQAEVDLESAAAASPLLKRDFSSGVKP